MRIFLTLTLVLSATGCFRTRLDAPVAGGHLLRSRQHFFIFGLIGDGDVNLKAECPTGVTSFGDEFRPSDIGFSILSLGLYTPKTVLIRCAE